MKHEQHRWNYVPYFWNLSPLSTNPLNSKVQTIHFKLTLTFYIHLCAPIIYMLQSTVRFDVFFVELYAYCSFHQSCFFCGWYKLFSQNNRNNDFSSTHFSKLCIAYYLFTKHCMVFCLERCLNLHAPLYRKRFKYLCWIFIICFG